MYDYIRRLLIVMAVALSIGILFISANVSFAETNNNYDYIWPTEGIVTDTFGTRKGKHYGIDIAAPRGTTVVAVSDGVVSKSYYSSTYGHVIFIDHSDGFETVYAHLHKRLVEEGDVIYQGEKIGIVGNTGRSSGDHLHFEMHEGNWTTSKKNAIDPMEIIGGKDNFFVLSEEAIEKNRYQVASVSHTMEQEKKLLEDEAFYITVKKGESLWSIAKGYQVSVNQLISWNNLSSDQVKIDQKLKIVPRGKYIVQRGDTLWKIAEQSGTTVSRIKKLNGLKGDVIQIGTLLDVVN
ncbi:peptidoglycan DD-metalloendopeptidase family protein [Anaerobacillus isosaccharinicus]|uniref:Peptidoglycan DD-metalloendopeptidase family protein n=1 Tax=Anaerobacillus isosaccharinicus TaxID=1532552 RepID=A0A1S2M4I5_9BACI|nr:peptidoglycan DD-metalloendopeptidase family protein [Anaerobacillus isosaccharinicus]MBA5585796.1 peptidoglycan DD-metalloendopeptidase family protein [Anaerobacillus isosaccharinicus]QOY35907.1 peptidoglycan DD-metalloendopeptidase family protein [Anaerobacillus isosaccharinicus]